MFCDEDHYCHHCGGGGYDFGGTGCNHSGGSHGHDICAQGGCGCHGDVEK